MNTCVFTRTLKQHRRKSARQNRVIPPTGNLHRAAGKELLAECRKLGGCDTGAAKLTGGYGLDCKYVIHTVGPVWSGGHRGERELLACCYRRSLELAEEKGCKTVAFPLISAGVYGYPKKQALIVAAKTISEFLRGSDMTVYMVVYDQSTLELSRSIFELKESGEFVGIKEPEI